MIYSSLFVDDWKQLKPASTLSGLTEPSLPQLLCNLIHLEMDGYLQRQKKMPLRLTSYVSSHRQLPHDRIFQRRLRCPVVGDMHVELITGATTSSSSIVRSTVIYLYHVRKEQASNRQLVVTLILAQGWHTSGVIAPGSGLYFTLDIATLQLRGLAASLADKFRPVLKKALGFYCDALSEYGDEYV